jgi:hypothetical protein
MNLKTYEFHRVWNFRTRIKYYMSYFAFISVVTREQLIMRFDTASSFRKRQSASLASKHCNNSRFTSVTAFTSQHNTTANLHAQHGNICNIQVVVLLLVTKLRRSCLQVSLAYLSVLMLVYKLTVSSGMLRKFPFCI